MAHASPISRRNLLLAGMTVVASPVIQLYGRETDFWNKKDPEQWSQDEIDRLITNSPWAKQIKVAIGSSDRRVPDRGATSGGAGRNIGIGIPGLGGLGIPGLGGGGLGRGGAARLPETKVVVRWESAKPVLDALHTKLPSAFADHYVISVSGVPASLDPQHEESDLDRMKQLTYLHARAGSAVQPGLLQKLPGATGATLLFGFSKNLIELSSADGEVIFSTQLGATPVKIGFELKQMLYRNELAV
jgi:hypothetical protein